MARKQELSKNQKISAEITRLKRIYKDIDERKRQILLGLIEECAFMRVTLQDLRNDIDKHGVIDEMPQGDYSILRESPYVKTYHTMIQRYTTASDKLLSLLPREERVIESDNFDDFVNGRDDI